MRTSWLRIQVVAAVIFAVLTTLTLLVPHWLEAFGFDPDHGNGDAEWLIAIAFGVAAALCGLAAGRGYYRARRGPPVAAG